MVKTNLIVLIVDDDTIFQFLTRKVLESTGYADTIAVCSNGQEAINLLEKNLNNKEDTPDAIFLDINMPVMNGWEFLKSFEQKIKPTISKSIPVYIISSSKDEADILHSKEFDSVSDYLIKPIFQDQFSKILSGIKDQKISHTSN